MLPPKPKGMQPRNEEVFFKPVINTNSMGFCYPKRVRFQSSLNTIGLKPPKSITSCLDRRRSLGQSSWDQRKEVLPQKVAETCYKVNFLVLLLLVVVACCCCLLLLLVVVCPCLMNFVLCCPLVCCCLNEIVSVEVVSGVGRVQGLLGVFLYEFLVIPQELLVTTMFCGKPYQILVIW